MKVIVTQQISKILYFDKGENINNSLYLKFPKGKVYKKEYVWEILE